MKGYRFYADYDSAAHRRRDTTPHGRATLGSTPEPPKNVIAVYLEKGGRPVSIFDGVNWKAECAAATFDVPNSDVSTTAASFSYLNERCRRISEAEAKRIHPRLFTYLEG